MVATNLPLIIVPDPSSPLRNDGLDRQQKPHPLRLEYAPLWIDERDSLALEVEPWQQVSGSKMIVNLAQPPDVLEGCHAHQLIAIRFIHAGRLSSGQS